MDAIPRVRRELAAELHTSLSRLQQAIGKGDHVQEQVLSDTQWHIDKIMGVLCDSQEEAHALKILADIRLAVQRQSVCQYINTHWQTLKEIATMLAVKHWITAGDVKQTRRLLAATKLPVNRAVKTASNRLPLSR